MVHRLSSIIYGVIVRDIFVWLEETADPQLYDSATFIYEDMASQSGESLPLIYQPFNASRQAHWRDRGAALDYLLSTNARGRRVLDFGPGDGWPSLIIAPQVANVVGVDGANWLSGSSANAQWPGRSRLPL